MGKDRNSLDDTALDIDFPSKISNFTFRFNGRRLILIKDLFRTKDDETFIFEYGLKYAPSILLCLIKRKKYILWGHGDDYTRLAKRNLLLRQIKHFILLNSDHFLAYTPTCASILVKAGYPIQKITILNNSTNTVRLRELIAKITEPMVEKFKIENQITSDICFLAIGSLIRERELDFLIKSLKVIREKIGDFVLLVIGAGPEQKRLDLAQYDFIRLLGHQDQEVLALTSKVCLALLNPGRVGLVAVDSFALGVPLIATINKRNAPEFYYLQDRVNCLISVHEIESYSNAILELINSKSLQKSLILNCLSNSEKYSIESMVRNFRSGCIVFENVR